ncbi:MAG: PIG-L family deacetylase [Candidatus Aureabacteria bacterium]|nr:PIG-L family deacetylase [Candidatus Auribacterota bacterium]
MIRLAFVNCRKYNGYGLAIIVVLAAGFLYLSANSCDAPHRSVVVFAPHPDDEVLMAAGVIQTALKEKVEITVVVISNGDREGGPRMGYKRMAESIEGLQCLGVKEDQVVFLGYGDQMLQRLYETSEPDFCLVTRSGRKKMTYANRGRGGTDFHSSWAGKPAEYTRNNILADIRQVLETFHPGEIFTASRYDAHRDHVATERLVSEALRALYAENPAGAPVLYEALVHAPGDGEWPLSRESSNGDFRMPKSMYQTPAVWESMVQFPVPSPELKYKAISAHKHQVKRKYLAFAGKTERFWKYAFPYR